jgi:hypothetical protein
MFVEWGFRPADVKRTTERIKVPGAVVKEWARTARQEEELAVDAEKIWTSRERGGVLLPSGAVLWSRLRRHASQYTAQLELYQRLIHCYRNSPSCSMKRTFRRVEIPFENGKDDSRDFADGARKRDGAMCCR